MRAVIFLVALLVTLAAAKITKDEGVLVLDDDNWEEVSRARKVQRTWRSGVFPPTMLWIGGVETLISHDKWDYTPAINS
jgi:hypothetical protein